MNNKSAFSNVSFEYLRNSPKFLNLMLNNITSCLLLLDNEMKLYSFNDPLYTLFSNSNNGDILYKKCGEVLGCAYAVEENKPCGETSNCNVCELREASLLSYSTKEPVKKQVVEREFYLVDGTKELKHLAFSTTFFEFDKDNYLMLIIDDVSDIKGKVN